MFWLPQCINDSRTDFFREKNLMIPFVTQAYGKKMPEAFSNKKGYFNQRVSRLMPLKSCMTSPMVFAPNAVWTELISSWIAASHI